MCVFRGEEWGKKVEKEKTILEAINSLVHYVLLERGMAQGDQHHLSLA